MRREREGRGVTVDYICAVTKVSSRHVEALEEDRLGDLPGGVFRKGIVRSYIAAVGLPEEDWIARFEASLREAGAAPQEEQDWTEFAENVRRNRGGGLPPSGARWLGVAAMVLTLLFCSWAVWHFLLHGKLPL
ncbi:MAG TPA: helix-turn-helix domain-containing protein [Granulicella sp.]